ncbi:MULTISPECIES: PTS sugar transporter subunit IIB [unclassified Cetobacterium]|uniref:PTS sugar transporter subunit IIB n=1 Tax=unclassified Cetobacterium TaxID=2630983 RepID=UPI00163D1492|nr:PTS sugar transporter subunit IIB [Cetobacterium sp. 8H]MBC2851619.1 PTS sugar transporter subunit IIB [Cetobacterium sp. 8H]
MVKILTVCGNGIGSSLMCAMKIEEICQEEGINASVSSCDFNSVTGKDVDLVVTIKELADQITTIKTAPIRSYTNKKKIKEDVLEAIKGLVK